MNNRRLLEIAEYISLIGSVAGSLAAMVSGQIAYATAPMSLSILLNFVNRYQFQQQSQSTNAVIHNTHQQILANIEAISSLALNQPAQASLSDVQQGLFNLKEEITATQIKLDRFASLSVFDPQLINEEISRMTSHYTDLSEYINAFRQQLSTLLVSERVEALQTTLFELKAEITSQRTQFDNQSSTYNAFNIESIQDEFFILREQNTVLQEFLDALVYRMLSDGSLSSRVCSDDIEKRLSKIVEYYREQREQKRQKYAVSLEPSDNQSYEQKLQE
ncbi:MAG: hypothetical protein PUP93_29075 [Rhizonema sp. NSF051]|nr:hypothetical protein [Rhizonema sp. NSF051]